MRTLTTLLVALLLAVPVAGQEREIRDANLPRALEAELLRLYAGPAERRDGPSVVAADEVVGGDIAATVGPLRIEGRVEGNVAMVGGDVEVAPGGSVTGRITVVAGEVRLADNARVGGTITAYGTPGQGRALAGRDREGRWDRRPRPPDQGFSRLTLRTGTSYNRVEGLPVMFGPVIQTAGANPLRLEALVLWRTEDPTLDTDRVGYQVRAEQFLGGARRLSVGASSFSVVDPMDRWQVSDLEASLSTVLFHLDQRDHFDRTGWSTFVTARPVPGLEAQVSFARERHASIAAGDPWALFNRADAWRLQPLVAEGVVRSVAASVALDRTAGREWRSGWVARARIERPVGGELTRPGFEVALPAGWPVAGPAVTPVEPRVLDLDFTTGLLDVRRYTPVGPGSELNARLVAGGTLTAATLPPQFQHALGGIGTLPGFTTFHGDCGARLVTGNRDGHWFHPAYGCDRFALAQVEYRGRLSLDFGFDHARHARFDHWDDFHLDLSPDWVVFFDAGRGWAYGDPSDPAAATRSTGTLVDVGLGVLLGRLGVYAALPLNDDVDRSPRFVLRWGPRF